MIETYKDYKKMPQYFTPDRLAFIQEDMQMEIGDDPEALEIYEDLLKASVKYANMRAMWGAMNREEKRENDALRTAYHDAVIMNLNMLARYEKSQGFPAEWREMIAPGSETVVYNRKAIGDFGCYLAFVSALCSR